jgi:hypothetical protein
MKQHRNHGLVVLAIWSLWVWTAGSAAEPRESPIANMSWLAGCWELVAGERRIEEQWMRPRGGMMLGMNRTVTGDTTREFEYMQIREEGGRLVFTARPSGQEGASFGSILVTESKVLFENAAHDFPQRIIYMRGEDGSLIARIEGETAGKPRGVDFPMRRTKCADGGDD